MTSATQKRDVDDAMKVVVKIGTSSLTNEQGHIAHDAVRKLCSEVAEARTAGHVPLIVSSGAAGAGRPVLGQAVRRPGDSRTLQALSAVGQSRLMAVYNEALETYGLVGGQVLLSPFDFFERTQYLHARGTLERMLELGVVPVINENDTVADYAIRFGDNDRIAALVAQLVDADRLVLLTDTPGLFTADPRTNADAELIHEIESLTEHHAQMAGGAGTDRGSGGMASKIVAARMGAWSGIPTVIAAADRPNVVMDAIAETPGVGTIVRPRARNLSARKLWIAFAMEQRGAVHVDSGAHRALCAGGGSLLAVGITKATGDFSAGDAVDLVAPDGEIFGRGIAAVSIADLADIQGRRTDALPTGMPPEVIHRDELAILV